MHFYKAHHIPLLLYFKDFYLTLVGLILDTCHLIVVDKYNHHKFGSKYFQFDYASQK